MPTQVTALNEGGWGGAGVKKMGPQATEIGQGEERRGRGGIDGDPAQQGGRLLVPALPMGLRHPAVFSGRSGGRPASARRIAQRQ